MFSTLLLVTACSKSEVVTSYEEVAKQDYIKQQPAQQEVNNQPVPVIFDVVSEEQATTRGAVNSKADLAIEGFSVFAYYTGTSTFDDAVAAGTAIPNLMYNQHVTGSSADGVNYTWSYTPVKYWPNNVGDKVTFFAYGPHVDLKTVTNEGVISFVQYPGDENAFQTNLSSGIVAISKNSYGGDPYLIYQLGDNVQMGDMRDVVYSSGTLNQTKQKISENISFSFNHALSALGFTVTGVFDEVTQTTKKIEADNYIRIESIQVTSSSFPLKAKMNLNGGSWTALDGAGYVSFYLNASQVTSALRYTSYTDAETAAPLLSKGVGRKSDGTDTADNTPQDVAQDDSGRNLLFYFIPPAKSTNSLPLSVTITYHTLTRDGRMLYGLGDIESTVTGDVTITKNAEDDWNGKDYTIQMQLGMRTVKFGVSDGAYRSNSQEDANNYIGG